MTDHKQKIVVILGQTATGKSALAVQLAKQFGGEIISADSRQVYKGLDIGTGKITQAEMNAIPHHLLDVADAGIRYTIADWKEAAEKLVQEIASRNKVPIICGGTGFYISALVDDLKFPDVDNDPDLQSRLDQLPAGVLYEELLKLDQQRALSMKENGEISNKRRLVRAIIVASKLGKVPLQNKKEKYQALFIGLQISDTELKAKIAKRLAERINAGMIDEAKILHEKGLSFERMKELGLEYKYLSQYLQNEIGRDQLIELLNTKIWQYAKRQKTWFKRDQRIKWYSPNDEEKILACVKDFLET